MADDDHVAMLKQGVATWNGWRHENPDIQRTSAVAEKLRSLGFVPMVFNFDKPETKDFTETVRLLANLSAS